ncbi:MAG: Crp/Fnr family transcriptional regulator [Notoacmeibacter sp.]|nr:Crp/Fnr family transcriptional regulator [Notoacmeibacter sp.]
MPNLTKQNRTGLLACLDEETYEWLSSVWTPMRFMPDETIVDFEDATSDVYFIASGEVRAILQVAIGKEVILGEFGRGGIFGELAALDGEPRSASLTALVQTHVMRIPEGIFNELMARSPAFTHCLLKSLSQRTRDLTNRIAELSFLDTRHRLYNTLLRMSRTRDEKDAERIISPPVIHAVLAEHIGASREAVSREMSKLAKENLVSRTRGAIILRQPGELSRRISATLQN